MSRCASDVSLDERSAGGTVAAGGALQSRRRGQVVRLGAACALRGRLLPRFRALDGFWKDKSPPKLVVAPASSQHRARCTSASALSCSPPPPRRPRPPRAVDRDAVPASLASALFVPRLRAACSLVARLHHPCALGQRAAGRQPPHRTSQCRFLPTTLMKSPPSTAKS